MKGASAPDVKRLFGIFRRSGLTVGCSLLGFPGLCAGYGTQVVKGEVCKTSIHRFESDPYLQILHSAGFRFPLGQPLVRGKSTTAFDFSGFGSIALSDSIRIKYEAGTAAKRRADHASENAEDYVELIDEMQGAVGAAHITDLARRLGVSHVTVHKTIKRLKALGLVRSEPHRAVALTEEGLVMAQQSRARHEVTLRFLRALGVSEDAAADAAEGIEHHVGEELLAQMSAFSAAMEKNGAVTREDLAAKPPTAKARNR